LVVLSQIDSKTSVHNCYQDTFRFGISIAHCLGVYFFPGHSVFDARKLKHFDDLFDSIDAVGLREYDGRMDGETERIAVRFDFVPTSNDS